MPEENFNPEMETEITPEGGVAPEGEIDNDKIERVLAVFAALTPDEKAVVLERLIEEMQGEMPETEIPKGEIPADEEMMNYGAMDERLQEF